MQWDVRVQWRQGIYYAALFVTAIWVIVLFALPPAARELLLPYALFMDVSIFGFYFMAGMLFFEKDDGVLEALVVTPMPRGAYLISKLVSLTLIAILVSVAVVLILHGFGGVNWVWLVLGVAFNSWLLTLVGFIIAARYNSITDFIFPSVIFIMPTQLPLLDHFGITESPLIWLMPTQGAMRLMDGAFHGLQGWEIALSIGYMGLACAVATWLAMRTYDQFVVRKQGLAGSSKRAERRAAPATEGSR
jgi:fluoroquinolone transport system permease protein